MTRGIAKKNGRPAHEMFEGRTKASVPMEEWMMRHRKEGYGRLPAFGRHRAGVASRLSHYVSQAIRPLIAWRGRR